MKPPYAGFIAYILVLVLKAANVRLTHEKKLIIVLEL